MKSHVSMEQHRCVVCSKSYDTGAILLDKRLAQTLERTTLTGTGLCPEHQQLADDNYIALIEVDPSKSGQPHDGCLKPEHAYRTGTVVHLKRHIAEQLFERTDLSAPVMFVEPSAVALLQQLSPPESE